MNVKGHTSQATLAFASFPLFANYLPFYDFSSFASYYFITIDDLSNFIYFISLFFLTILGSRFPDLDLKLKGIFGNSPQYVYHRQLTHSLTLLFLGFYFSIYIENIFLFFFFFGVASHLLGDMLTGSIPIFFTGAYYNFFSRIGTDRFLPKRVSKKWNISIPLFFDKISSLIFISSIFTFSFYFFKLL
jgi:hypothetical protein